MLRTEDVAARVRSSAENEDCDERLARILRETLWVLEPRVLDLWEIPVFDGAVYLQTRKEGVIGWVVFRFRFGRWWRFASTLFCDGDEYGAEWRCWSARPSEEMLRSPWDVRTAE